MRWDQWRLSTIAWSVILAGIILDTVVTGDKKTYSFWSGLSQSMHKRLPQEGYEPRPFVFEKGIDCENPWRLVTFLWLWWGILNMQVEPTASQHVMVAYRLFVIVMRHFKYAGRTNSVATRSYTRMLSMEARHYICTFLNPTKWFFISLSIAIHNRNFKRRRVSGQSLVGSAVLTGARNHAAREGLRNGMHPTSSWLIVGY